MERKDLIARAKKIAKDNEVDRERSHAEFDDLLIEYINDKKLTQIYKKMTLWCA